MSDKTKQIDPVNDAPADWGGIYRYDDKKRKKDLPKQEKVGNQTVDPYSLPEGI